MDLGIWETSHGVDAGADANGDGESSGADFLAWQQQYTGDLLPLSATVFGIVASVIGAVAIGWGLESDVESSNDLLGGVFATLGAVGLAVYLLMGRNLRRRHSLGVYMTICYGAATGYLGLAAIGTGQQVRGFSTSTWCSFIGLALVSQVLGHTANNWALRFFSVSMIAVALLGEPLIATLLAYLLFDETLTAIQIGGAALILAGIYLAARSERR